MKKFIKQLLRESLLDEAAFTSSRLPEGTGLFAKEQNSNELVLFNPKTKDAYGIINFVHNPNLSDFQYVISVAAEPGFGPLMYELAMMYVADKHNNFLTPARDGNIRDGAWRIWEKMYQRDDVTKKVIDFNNPNFKYDIIFPSEEVGDDEREEAFNELDKDEQHSLIVFNAGYTMKPNSGYNNLMNVASKYNEKTYDLASKIGDELWQKAYN